MLWKIYFWFMTILLVANWASAIFSDYNFWAIYEVVPNGLALVGLFSFTFKKKIFRPNFWKFVFVFSIVSEIVSGYIELSNQGSIYHSNPIMLWSIFVFMVILLSPTYYSVYKIGFTKLDP